MPPAAHTHAHTHAHTYEDVLYSTSNGVATITLNRPDKLNAWRAPMDRDVRLAMRAATDDADVRVIILTGAGKGFCAGADMGMLQNIQAGAARSDNAAPGSQTASTREPWDAGARADFQHEYSWFPSVPKPIIGAINGACAGLGLVLSLYTDIRFAADTAKFTTSFAKRGLVAEHGVSWLLPRLIGFANAADLLYSSRVVTAAEAHALGLVTRVFPAATFLDEVNAYASMLASEVSPRSLREMKRELWNAQLQPLGEAIQAANTDMPASFASADFKEGVAHFVEKRAARFAGL